MFVIFVFSAMSAVLTNSDILMCKMSNICDVHHSAYVYGMRQAHITSTLSDG